MRSQILILFVFLMLLSQLSYGDEVYFKNGDRLTGKILRLTDGKLVIKSDVGGEVTVELSNIQTLSSDEPVTVNLKDGTGFEQQLSSSKAGRFSIKGSESINAQEFAVNDIVSINPPIPKWTGNVSAGITSTHGNTKTENITGSANLKKRTDKDRTTLSADYVKLEQEDPATDKEEAIEDWWRAKTKYDYFFSKKMYGYLDGRYEKDAVAELDRRVTVGIGAGYQWIESADMNFSTELGLASLYEKFDNQTDSNSEISAQLGYYFDKKLRKNLSFVHELTYYPALEKPANYYLTTTAELRADFTNAMFMNLKAILDYDATPAINAHKTDVKYFLGLGYSF
jgi:putative salt-induced outer membrane protein YdiY/preprotein translocase subunit YajC